MLPDGAFDSETFKKILRRCHFVHFVHDIHLIYVDNNIYATIYPHLH